jgi:F420-non-reducing hydrogenase large subunit
MTAPRTITIDPVTRLEGHARIEIVLDDAGNVERAYYQVPEVRGFEAFCLGRPVEEMPQITSRICGVCPTAHHTASSKALDDLFGVTPPPAARAIREMVYHAFMLEDHALHVYFLGGPDLLLGPEEPPETRNFLGVMRNLGPSEAHRVISIRRRLREIIAIAGGRAIHPAMGLPGGVSRGISADELAEIRRTAHDAVAFALDTLRMFRENVVRNPSLWEMMTSEVYSHRTYYMGMVDQANRLSFCDGDIRVMDPSGRECERFAPQAYSGHIAQRREPWTYAKFCYLKSVGWHGLTDGHDSGIYAVAPLARLNVADSIATPYAQDAYTEYLEAFGGKPVHQTLANHWARVIEMVYAAERLAELAQAFDPSVTELRTMPTHVGETGIGAVEAPRGTLIHHYEADEDGLIREAHLIVATQNNAARIAMSVDRAARALIRNGEVREGLLNRIEMAFRAYDPCNACTTHSIGGDHPMVVTLRSPDGRVLRQIRG